MKDNKKAIIIIVLTLVLFLIILLPIEPVRDGYIFVCWLDGNGLFITEDTIITNNITLKAMWIKKDAKTSTVKFDTDGGSKVKNIIVENGKVILLPINPQKKAMYLRDGLMKRVIQLQKIQ